MSEADEYQHNIIQSAVQELKRAYTMFGDRDLGRLSMSLHALRALKRAASHGDTIQCVSRMRCVAESLRDELHAKEKDGE